jgi:hypothetical protein
MVGDLACSAAHMQKFYVQQHAQRILCAVQELQQLLGCWSTEDVT